MESKSRKLIPYVLQEKTIETTLTALAANDASLPPLMNPSMLEASDDLTNLSHLNEPAGMNCMEMQRIKD